MTLRESNTVEFKETVTDVLKKEVIAFANSNGGTIYIGITDDGIPVGVDNADKTMQQVSNMIRDSIKPDVTLFIKYSIQENQGKSIIVIQVQKGTHAPYYLINKGIRPEGVFVRQGTSAVPASEDAIRRMIKESDGTHFESMRSLNQSLTFNTMKEECLKRKIKFGTQQQITLGIQSSDGVYTNLGLLLSDQCKHTIKAAVFNGTKKEEFQDRREFSGSLLKQMNDAYDFIDLNNKKRASFLGLQRIDRRDYPEEALREALMNSLVHREYSFSGSTLINIFTDRIEFVSLGGLVQGLTLDDILLGISQCRNEKLAAVFYRLDLIEAYGTGIPKIMESYPDQTAPQPQIISTDNAFKIILPNRNYTNSMAANLSLLEQQILHYATTTESLSRRDIENKFKISRSKATTTLNHLIKQGLLKTVGNGRNRRYALSRTSKLNHKN